MLGRMSRMPVLFVGHGSPMNAIADNDYTRALRPLRDRGILVLGSGNVVHNLRRIRWEDDAAPYDWAVEFDDWVRRKILETDFAALVSSYAETEAGRLSVPTPDHYDPLLYVLGAADEADRPRFELEGIQNASISMRCVSFGLA